MKKKKIYPNEVYYIVNKKLPKSIVTAIENEGWNIFGIYEEVDEELKKYKKRIKKINNNE